MDVVKWGSWNVAEQRMIWRNLDAAGNWEQALDGVEVEESNKAAIPVYKLDIVQTFEELGPKGTKFEIIITNNGKTNTNSHIEAKALQYFHILIHNVPLGLSEC